MLTHRLATPTPPARVVVCGASGFVGGSLMHHLASRHVPTLGVGSAQLNLCAPGASGQLAQMVKPADAVVIISALTPDKGKDTGTLMNNLEMGRQLGAWLATSSCAHVVYISSDAVYADDANPVRETSPVNPATGHGLMHLVRERMLTQAGVASGTPLAILRPCALYGPGDTHQAYGPNRFLRSAVRERTITLIGQGEERRDHVYIEDLSQLVGLCLERRSEGIVNVATGRSVSFAAVAERVASCCECAIRTIPRRAPVTHRHMDISGLIRAFPMFRLTPLAEGLAQTLASLAEPSVTSHLI